MLLKLVAELERLAKERIALAGDGEIDRVITETQLRKYLGTGKDCE
jgi:hypothetical protein